MPASLLKLLSTYLEAVSSIEHKKKDFGEDSSSKAALETLVRRYTHYMGVAGWGGKPLGTVMLSHMKLYYQWRFQRALRNYKTRAAGGKTPDQILLNEKDLEPAWAKERNALTKTTNTLKTESDTHTQLARALRNSGAWMFGAGQKMYEKELDLARKFEDQYLTQKAILDTMPSSDGSFVKNSNLYDEQLVMDALILQVFAKMKGRDNLRPHYRALLEAYEAESNGNGLKDKEIIAFFDTYVHDSLAGFASDATLPSDPRVIYMGGDDKLEYANNSKPVPQGVPGSRPGSMVG